MLPIFAKVLLPIFVVVALGVALEHRARYDTGQLSRLSLYVLSPSLAFTSIVRSTLALDEVWTITAFSVVMFALVGLLGEVVGRVMRLGVADRNAFVLSTVLVNAGNMGLPIMLLAFGDAGLERAVVFFVISALLTNTVGVMVACRGRGAVREAILSPFRLPLIYAAVLGLVLRLGNIEVPTALFRPFELMAAAAVPMLLLVQGMRLRRLRLADAALPVALATAIKLVLTPVLALAVASLMGIGGLTRLVVVVQSSMPTAVFATVLAIRFDVDSDVVAGSVAVSTLASVVTLTVLLWLLGVRVA